VKNTRASEEAEGRDSGDSTGEALSLKTAQVSLSLLNPLKISRVFLESRERRVRIC